MYLATLLYNMVMEKEDYNDCFTLFDEKIDHISLPTRFTFPFYYDPHPLSELAAAQLQKHLSTQKEWEHNFGIDPNKKGLVIGKMFGVLVVKDTQERLGFLSAFSGKLADKNHLPGFVPPIFDMLTVGSFFEVGSEQIAQLTAQIESLESDPSYGSLQLELEKAQYQMDKVLSEKRKVNKANKRKRKFIREQTPPALLEFVHQKLIIESQQDNISLIRLKEKAKIKVTQHEKALKDYQSRIEDLKAQRKNISQDLQHRLFEQYQFLNIKGEIKSLNDIFADVIPIAGTGECSAPKLLQFAFKNNLTPIAMAEFWWGEPPKSQVRRHKQFYPACHGKCRPVLAHMLQHLDIDEDPMLRQPDPNTLIHRVYEDDHMLVINKPPELLSVPGKTITDCVVTRMKKAYPDATGPLVVHRLDMSTSGLMLIAKTEEAHKYLQHQFIHRTIKKKYIALLDGYLSTDKGMIDLPLRVDLDDRPRQLVCYEYGKSAQTQYEIIERKKKQTRIAFYPITGRTHQLRVHAAHASGLGIPIVGDDLYGTKGDRLCLHAAMISFQHPITKEEMTIEVEPNF